ncbi:MAG: hypothetical protein Q8R07_02310 [Candidatus Uhrbacteria bacterium]|nr:hypothetical protein [Candidatus Uhrbacteria bacterium]
MRMIFLPLHFELDRVAHLFGGLTIAWATANFYREAQARSWIPRFSMIVWSFVVVATAELIGTLWEFLEFYLLNDLVPHFGMMLPDTIDDLTLDLLGAILFVAVLAPRMEKFLRRRTS